MRRPRRRTLRFTTEMRVFISPKALALDDIRGIPETQYLKLFAAWVQTFVEAGAPQTALRMRAPYFHVVSER